MKEALKMALKALENTTPTGFNMETDKRFYEAITAIKESLSEPEPEPVAWMFQHDETGRMNYVSNDEIHDPTMFLGMNPRYALVCPLYTTPPQRKPLTVGEVWRNDQFMSLNTELGCGMDLLMEVVKAIEAAHNIKE